MQVWKGKDVKKCNNAKYIHINPHPKHHWERFWDISMLGSCHKCWRDPSVLEAILLHPELTTPTQQKFKL